MRSLILGSLKLALAFGLIYGILFALLVKVRFNEAGLIYRTSELLAKKGGSTWLTFDEFDPEQYKDVAVVGSSHALRGYDPRIFSRRGYRSFNLANTAQTPLNTWPIVQSCIDSMNTGLLIIDMYVGVSGSNGIESAIDLIQNVKDDDLAFREAWAIRDPRVFNMLMLRYVKRNSPALYGSPEYVGAGYRSRADSAKYVHPHNLSERYTLQERQTDALDRIRDHAQVHGIPIVFVTHPMPSSSDTAAHRRFVNALRVYLGANGPPYLDFALDHDLDDLDHFYDQSHLNQAGVDRFVPRLIDSLEVLGLLTPHELR